MHQRGRSVCQGWISSPFGPHRCSSGIRLNSEISRYPLPEVDNAGGIDQYSVGIPSESFRRDVQIGRTHASVLSRRPCISDLIRRYYSGTYRFIARARTEIRRSRSHLASASSEVTRFDRSLRDMVNTKASFDPNNAVIPNVESAESYVILRDPAQLHGQRGCAVEPLISRRVSAEHVQGLSSSLGTQEEDNSPTAQLKPHFTCLSLDTHRFLPSALSRICFPVLLVPAV